MFSTVPKRPVLTDDCVGQASGSGTHSCPAAPDPGVPQPIPWRPPVDPRAFHRRGRNVTRGQPAVNASSLSGNALKALVSET